MKKLKKLLFRWEVILILSLIIEIIVFGSINPRFLKINVLLGSINDFVSISIISIFVTFVMITGGIDIQAGSVVGLTSIVMGLLWKDVGINIWLVIPMVLLVGAFCGLLSGFFIAYTRVQAMVVTLGGKFLFSGAAIIVAGLGVSSAYEGISGYPQSFLNIGQSKIFKFLPVPFVIFFILTIIAYILLHKTKFGRNVFLVGVNQNAAKYSGVNTNLVTMATYILSGISASIAGIILTSYLGSSRADLGREYTLPIITAVVLGGTSSTGGKGNVFGTAIASIVIGILKFGLQMSGVSTQYLDIPVGVLLIVAVAIRCINGTIKIPGLDRIKDKFTRQKQNSINKI